MTDSVWYDDILKDQGIDNGVFHRLVRCMIQRDDSPILFLYGVPCCGKTELASLIKSVCEKAGRSMFELDPGHVSLPHALYQPLVNHTGWCLCEYVDTFPNLWRRESFQVPFAFNHSVEYPNTGPAIVMHNEFPANMSAEARRRCHFLHFPNQVKPRQFSRVQKNEWVDSLLIRATHPLVPRGALGCRGCT